MRAFALGLLLLLPALAGCAVPFAGGGMACVDGPVLPARIVWTRALPGDEAALSSPLLADLDGDNFTDIVVGNGEGSHELYVGPVNQTLRGVLAAKGATGIPLWETRIDAVDSSPVIGDVTGDGRPEIVVGLRQRQMLVTLDPRNGTPTGHLDLHNWVQTPALADVDADGVLDILVVTGGLERHDQGSGEPGEILALHGKGLQPVWRANLSDEAYSSPAVAATGDGGSLVVVHGIGGEMHHGGAIQARDARTGKVLWEEPTSTGVVSSAAVADFDGDGARDLVVGEWWGALHARRLSDGAKLWDADLKALSWTSPALGEFTGDGKPDVVATGFRPDGLVFDKFNVKINGKAALGKGHGGVVAAFEGATGRILWQRDTGVTPGTPVTADVDGDGTMEILLVCTRGDAGYLGKEGGVLAVLDGPTGRTKGLFQLPGGAISTPALGDVNHDGHPDITIATVKPAQLLMLTLDSKSDLAAPLTWPRFRGNAHGTGSAAAADR